MKQDITEDLLIRYILGEASEREAQEIILWINASDAHARQFEQTKFILETSRHLAQVSPTSETDAWDTFKQKRGNLQRPGKVLSIRGHSAWVRIAASILFIAGAASTGYYLYRQGNKPPEYITIKSQNKVRIDTLPDGSIVHLNKNSAIHYASNFKAHRDIKLTGEAFFNVVHNDSAPFTVHVNDVDIRDIGTAFNISSNAKRIEVIVENGIVKVSRHTTSIELKQEEMVSIKPGDQQLKKEKNSDLLYNYYRTNEFVANHTPLKRLVDRLNEAYGANIRIEGRALSNAPITGTFPNESLDKILEVIMLTTPEIHLEKTGDGIVLR